MSTTLGPELGRHGEAQPLQERALAIREATLGAEHLDIADSLGHLAALAQRRGDEEGAHRYALRAYGIQAAQLDPGHRDIGHAAADLGEALWRLGRPAEAWQRFEGTGAEANDRLHFFSLTAHAMRNILVDRFRRRAAAKRGSDPTLLSLETGFSDRPNVSIDLIDLDRALERFADVSPRAARIVELRFFAGLTNEEIAQALEVSEATVTREWRAARLWLADALGPPA